MVVFPADPAAIFGSMQDALKPRRPLAEEQAEITDGEIRKHTAADARFEPALLNPPLSVLVARMEANEEATLQAREASETSEEAEESARILGVEAQISDEIPRLRERELRRTFSTKKKRAYAAVAVTD